ncbi:hypothetical protein R3P38DRAFT_2763602 [Favolaschia claudopus]|uniref:Uncharacterized protein n=1 Tax=Favolaschia claudopus TaxID=2862362 RepID=A0AAW0DFU6_9AGAR
MKLISLPAENTSHAIPQLRRNPTRADSAANDLDVKQVSLQLVNTLSIQFTPVVRRRQTYICRDCGGGSIWSLSSGRHGPSPSKDRIDHNGSDEQQRCFSALTNIFMVVAKRRGGEGQKAKHFCDKRAWEDSIRVWRWDIPIFKGPVVKSAAKTGPMQFPLLNEVNNWGRLFFFLGNNARRIRQLHAAVRRVYWRPPEFVVRAIGEQRSLPFLKLRSVRLTLHPLEMFCSISFQVLKVTGVAVDTGHKSDPTWNNIQNSFAYQINLNEMARIF